MKNYFHTCFLYSLYQLVNILLSFFEQSMWVAFASLSIRFFLDYLPTLYKTPYQKEVYLRMEYWICPALRKFSVRKDTIRIQGVVYQYITVSVHVVALLPTCHSLFYSLNIAWMIAEAPEVLGLTICSIIWYARHKRTIFKCFYTL